MSYKGKQDRRVVVTGIGLLSGFGLDLDEVSRGLHEGRSTIAVSEERVKLGFQSPLSGTIPDVDLAAYVTGDDFEGMSETVQYAVVACELALRDSGAEVALFDSDRAGVLIGNDSSAQTATIVLDSTRENKSTEPLGRGCYANSINSSPSLQLSQRYGARGGSFCISAACSSGAHAIGIATMMIKLGWTDRMITGGTQELCWESMAAFDALRSFSLQTEHPERSSRPFSKDREGLVPSGGGAILVIEELESARERGAKIYGEIIGYALSSDGHHLTTPSSDGARRCIEDVLRHAGVEAGEVDYINAHATATHNGDAAEAKAIHAVFGSEGPPVSSTKSMTGHECWMAGASEAAYTLLMMRDSFVAPNINFAGFSDEMAPINIATKSQEREIDIALTNSFGFGGTNACLLLKKM